MQSGDRNHAMKSSRRRALEVLGYFAIAGIGVTALVAVIVWYVDKYPDSPPPDGAAFALISTPVLFGWLIRWRRRYVGSWRFWVLLLGLLAAHSVAYWKLVVPVYPFPMPIFLFLWVVEGVVLGVCTRWVMTKITGDSSQS
jgi:hypothetical protein